MISREISERIKKRIDESKGEYSREEQRAELLIRNKSFRKEWDEFYSKWGWLLNLELKPEDMGLKPSLEPALMPQFIKKIQALAPDSNIFKQIAPADLIVATVNKHEEFCTRWGLKRSWDGVTALGDYIGSSPKIITSITNFLIAEGECHADDINPQELETNGLYLKVDPWTQLEDIEKIWPRIEKMQRSTFGYKTRIKPNFGRDLCWYDLNKDHYLGELSNGSISVLWKKYFSQNISRNTIKGAIQRIQKYVDRLGPDPCHRPPLLKRV